MSDDEAVAAFQAIRFHATEGQPVCVWCECAAAYPIRTRPGVFKCKACLRFFSLTSRTIFADRKLPYRDILHAIALYTNGAKGFAALHLGRELEVQLKTAFVLLHKIRECLGEVQQGQILEGKVEIDGAYYGGYQKPANRVQDRVDFRREENQKGNRQVVVIMRERGGRSVPFVGKAEGDALDTIIEKVHPDATVFHDELPAYKLLRDLFTTRPINHSQRYSIPEEGIHINGAESSHIRTRRAEIGIHHHIAGPHLLQYANEMSWREDRRRISNGEQFLLICATVVPHKPSKTWRGYWQRGKWYERKRRRDAVARSMANGL
jgi:transposase-like protein